MTVSYIPPSLLNTERNCDFYLTGPYLAGLHNIQVSIDFNSFQDEQIFQPCLKAKHFFSHITVGIVLFLIPIANVFLFISLLDSQRSTRKSSPPLAPPPKEIVIIPTQPSKVQNKITFFQEVEYQAKKEKIAMHEKPLLGKKSNSMSILNLKQIETAIAGDFFRLFPNETRDSKLGNIRKKIGETAVFHPDHSDREFIKSLYLNTAGRLPQDRFNLARKNLNTLNDYLNKRFSHLKNGFYLQGNYKNDMQKNIDNIPYIHLIKILFISSPEEFLNTLDKYSFVELKEVKGEKIPLRIDTAS